MTGPPPHRPPTKRRLTPHARRNRADWDRTAAWFEDRHGALLARGGAMGWGMFHVPERELHLLGSYRGKDVLELGCGAARWSIALYQAGARVIGLDLSPKRLEQARANMRAAHVDFPLIEASAESVPLPSACLDIVFCDHGAMSFADPYLTVPEVARLLRPGGTFAFCMSSPVRMLCEDRTSNRLHRALRNDYFSLHKVEFPESVEFQLPYGEWVRLFRASGFEIEALEDMRPPPRARTTFLDANETEWARRWPMEMAWKLRKARSGPD